MRRGGRGQILAAMAQRRVSRRRILYVHSRKASFVAIDREILAEEILEPLGFRWTNFGVAPEDVPAVGLSYATGKPAPPAIEAAFPGARVLEFSSAARG